MRFDLEIPMEPHSLNSETHARLGNPAHLIDPDATVSEIVKRHPAAMRVLGKYQIDLCCGGRHPLSLVATTHHISLEMILNEIDAAIRGGGDMQQPFSNG